MHKEVVKDERVIKEVRRIIRERDAVIASLPEGTHLVFIDKSPIGISKTAPGWEMHKKIDNCYVPVTEQAILDFAKLTCGTADAVDWLYKTTRTMQYEFTGDALILTDKKPIKVRK